MSKKYIVVEKDGQKWLRPVNVPYPNEDDQDNEGVFQLADAVLYKQLTTDLPYIGTHPAGATLDESQIQGVIRQSALLGEVSYTDADHIPGTGNMVDKPFKAANVRPLVNQMLSEEISFSRFVEILNETAMGNTKIQCHCEDEDTRHDCLADCDYTGSEPDTMLNRYRVGRRLGRAVLDDVQGKCIVVF